MLKFYLRVFFSLWVSLNLFLLKQRKLSYKVYSLNLQFANSFAFGKITLANNKQKSSKKFPIFLMFTLTWKFCQCNRYFVLKLDSSTCLDFIVWTASLFQNKPFSQSSKYLWHACRKLLEKMSRSSRPKVFFKKGVLKNFAIFIEKDLCRSPFLNRPAALLKKIVTHSFLPVKFCGTVV